jgi:hypothetical protein
LPSAAGGYSWDPHYNLDTVAPHPAPSWLGHRERQRGKKPATQCRPQELLHRSCERVRTAADSQKHAILNRETFRIGTLVSAGLLPESGARDDLRAAVAILIATSDANQQRTWETFETAFRDGLAAPRRAR